MRVSLITMHRIYNFGSVLQTYATQKVFEKAGAECEVLDYISPYRTKSSFFLDYPERLEGKEIKKVFYYLFKIPSFILKDYTFGGFIKKYINLSKRRYITYDDILQNPPAADIYVTGSDQVWNSKYNRGVDDSYYLGYAPKNAKKVAFVASFGRTELDKEELYEIKPLLQQYDIITVREISGVLILEEIGISSTCLIDPTLQITGKEWRSLASPRLLKEKYLLLFLLYNEDNGATEYARKVATTKGLKLVKLSWELKKDKGIDKLYTHRKPQDFLSLFANADFIVTNSFHGVAFSINLNRQFVFIPRREFNGRIESLLEQSKLKERMINDLNNYEITDKTIEYHPINEWLDKEREKAAKYVINMIN